MSNDSSEGGFCAKSAQEMLAKYDIEVGPKWHRVSDEIKSGDKDGVIKAFNENYNLETNTCKAILAGGNVGQPWNEAAIIAAATGLAKHQPKVSDVTGQDAIQAIQDSGTVSSIRSAITGGARAKANDSGFSGPG